MGKWKVPEHVPTKEEEAELKKRKDKQDVGVYLDLANEIILQAVSDYRKKPQLYEEDVRTFFYGEWYTILSETNGPRIFRLLHQEVHSGLKKKAQSKRGTCMSKNPQSDARKANKAERERQKQLAAAAYQSEKATIAQERILLV